MEPFDFKDDILEYLKKIFLVILIQNFKVVYDVLEFVIISSEMKFEVLDYSIGRKKVHYANYAPNSLH